MIYVFTDLTVHVVLLVEEKSYVNNIGLYIYHVRYQYSHFAFHAIFLCFESNLKKKKNGTYCITMINMSNRVSYTLASRGVFSRGFLDK